MCKAEVLILKKSIVTVKTVTIGQKGRKALAKHGIKSNIVKIDSSNSEYGCSYGLEIPEKDFYEAIQILRSNNIEYGVYRPK